MNTSISFDGEQLKLGRAGGAREFAIDPRCLAGTPVAGAFVNVCALPDPAARLPFDDPLVGQVRREALAWWIGLLGENLLCLSTLALDSVYCAGAVTATRGPAPFRHDPFARLFPATTLRCDFLCAVAPPAGPVIERYAGIAWPGGSFAAGA